MPREPRDPYHDQRMDPIFLEAEYIIHAALAANGVGAPANFATIVAEMLDDAGCLTQMPAPPRPAGETGPDENGEVINRVQ